MPMLTVWRCPVCGAESEPSATQPANWISVTNSGIGAETFESWQCAATYAQQAYDVEQETQTT